ncbi:MAG: nicotinamide riboside transporter PnuC [Brevinema sp.]
MSIIRILLKGWTLPEILWIITVFTVMITVWMINQDTPFMLAMSLTGSIGLVLGAKGKISGLVLSLINALLYAIYCYELKLYGEVMYNIFYSIPTSAVGIYLWNKHKNQTGEVQFRHLSLQLVIVMFVSTLITTIAYAEILKLLGGRLAFMDSLTTVVSVIASLLFILRFADQWLMWILVNVLSISMWIMVYMSGDSTSFIVIIMKIVNLCNAIYGYINWKKMAEA